MVDRLQDWALVAHELAGALSPVQSAIALLRDGAAPVATPESDRLLEIASRGLLRADRVLQNLLAIAAPDQHRARLEAIDAARFLEETRADFASEAASRGVTIQVRAEPGVEFPADSHCLEQILVNLMTNALKFTPPGGRVVLHARRLRGAVLSGRLVLLGGGLGSQPAFVCVEVRDTGIGLSEEARRRLFEPFYRAPEVEERGIPGSGLGLAVARRLADLMHADLRPARAAGGGTRFLLTLPADEPTWDLVRRIDGVLGLLGPRLERQNETLVVLRDATGLDPWEADGVGTALRRLLPDPRAAVLPLSPTTWVACAPARVRELLVALGAALETTFDAPRLERLTLHAQYVRRGSSADERLLQGLVRCRHPLSRVRASRPAAGGGRTPSRDAAHVAAETREVADATRPARG